MELFDLIAREHARFDRDLARCIDAPDSARLTGTDRKAVVRVAAWTTAVERGMFPALLAVAPEDAAVLAALHDALKAQAALALTQCRAGVPDSVLALQSLRQQLSRYVSAPALQRQLSALFTAAELRDIAGNMRLQLIARRSESRPPSGALQLLKRCISRWPSRRRRTVCTLKAAVFVYRAASAKAC